MTNQTPALPPMPLLEFFAEGLRTTATHWRLFVRLSVFPFFITFASVIGLRLFEASLTPFLTPIVMVPANAVTGLECALILRFLLLSEFPIIPDAEHRRARNAAIMRSGAVYTVVTYFVAGVYAGLIAFREFMTKNPEAAAPYLPLLFAILILIFWGARWFWLHVPPALDMPARALYARIGAWRGSLAVFALYALCSVLLNFITGVARLVVHAVFGLFGKGFVAALDDGVISAMTIVLAVLFTAVTAAAVKSIMTKTSKDFTV